MEHYQEIVENYLRAKRSLFINTECILQIEPGKMPPKGSSWCCDAVAVDFEAKAIFLCEVSYSKTQQSQLQRLKAWNDRWHDVCSALVQDNHLPAEWPVRPWIFVPEEYSQIIVEGLQAIRAGQQLNFLPLISTLEMVQPWRYCTYDRNGENLEFKPDCIPLEWRN